MPERAFLSKMERSYIDVILKDGTYHHFTPRVLDVLLDTQRVQKFRRTSGWVTVGVDPIRMPRASRYDYCYLGKERRKGGH